MVSQPQQQTGGLANALQLYQMFAGMNKSAAPGPSAANVDPQTGVLPVPPGGAATTAQAEGALPDFGPPPAPDSKPPTTPMQFGGFNGYGQDPLQELHGKGAQGSATGNNGNLAQAAGLAKGTGMLDSL